MNTNEVSQKGGRRLERIQKVSRCFRAVFFAFSLLLSVTTLLCLAGLVFISIVQWHGFGEVLRFCLAAGTNFACAVGTWFCYRLFNLYSRGDLFTAKTVQYIRRIAGMCFVLMLAQFLCQRFLPGYAVLRETLPGWEWTTWLELFIFLFPSFLILFIAWIMNEGRKIREEQELTV